MAKDRLTASPSPLLCGPGLGKARWATAQAKPTLLLCVPSDAVTVRRYSFTNVTSRRAFWPTCWTKTPPLLGTNRTPADA